MEAGFGDMAGEQIQGRERARETVERHMISLGWNPTDLARHSGLDIGTVADFIGGQRWPQAATQNKIEQAFNWGPGSIVLLAKGGDPVSLTRSPETVTPPAQDDGILGSLPPGALDGLDETAVAEVIAAARLRALERAREIRRQLDT